MDQPNQRAATGGHAVPAQFSTWWDVRRDTVKLRQTRHSPSTLAPKRSATCMQRCTSTAQLDNHRHEQRPTHNGILSQKTSVQVSHPDSEPQSAISPGLSSDTLLCKVRSAELCSLGWNMLPQLAHILCVPAPSCQNRADHVWWLSRLSIISVLARSVARPRDGWKDEPSQPVVLYCVGQVPVQGGSGRCRGPSPPRPGKEDRLDGLSLSAILSSCFINSPTILGTSSLYVPKQVSFTIGLLDFFEEKRPQ